MGKNYPNHVLELNDLVQKYDYVVPVLFCDIMGGKLLVSIYGEDFLGLLKKAGILPLLWCPQCGVSNDYKSGNFIKKGVTHKGRQRWQCKACGRKVVDPLQQRKKRCT